MNEQIALGFGNNVDYEIVWDAAVFEDLIVHYGISDAELTTDAVIASERDLVVSILAFLKIAQGGERFVSTSALIEEFSQKFKKKITLGGTSVRAAIAMHKLGCSSALHLVTVNDHVRRLIPPNSPFVCSSGQDSLHPHLIVQFGKDVRVKAGDIDIRASQANRLIYHSDDDNIAMNINEDFAELAIEAKALLISGFNAMQSKPLLVARLESLKRIIKRLPQDALVFYEDGGYFDLDFSLLIYRALGKSIDIFSLNEDELQAHLKRKVDLLDAAQVQTALADLHKQLRIDTIVLHTRHGALAYGHGASRFAKPLKVGTSLATARFCYGDDFTAQHVRHIASRPPRADSAAFAEAIQAMPGDKIVCAPVADVPSMKAVTIGLGDAFVGGFLSALLPKIAPAPADIANALGNA